MNNKKGGFVTAEPAQTGAILFLAKHWIVFRDNRTNCNSCSWIKHRRENLTNYTHHWSFSLQWQHDQNLNTGTLSQAKGPGGPSAEIPSCSLGHCIGETDLSLASCRLAGWPHSKAFSFLKSQHHSTSFYVCWAESFLGSKFMWHFNLQVSTEMGRFNQKWYQLKMAQMGLFWYL